MYRELPQSGDGVVGFEVQDRSTGDEVAAMLARLESVIAERGSVRLLVLMPEIPPDLDALDEDLGFWPEQGEDIERYTVVGDSSLLEWATEVADRGRAPTASTSRPASSSTPGTGSGTSDRRRAVVVGSRLRYRTTVTGTVDRSTTPSATLPRNATVRSDRPRWPT